MATLKSNGAPPVAPHPDPEVVAYAVRSLLRDIDPYWADKAFDTIMSLVRQCKQVKTP